MSRGTVALALAIIDIVGFAALSAWSMTGLGRSQAMDPVSAVAVLAAVTAFASMGALLMRRAPGNLIGALLLATGTAQFVGIGFQVYGIVGASAVPPWAGAAMVSVLTDVWFIAPFVIALIGVPLVFPDGRLPSRRFRVVAWVTVAGMVMQARMGLTLLTPGLADLDAVTGVLNVVSVGALVFGFCGAGVAIWVRFRRGDPVQRQQVKWLLAVVGVAAIFFPLAMVFGGDTSMLDLAFWAVGLLAYLALPVAIGIAVLRYRLYEIDRIISRTIGYLIVTTTLAVVFAGAILLFQAVLEPLVGGDTGAVAASTLVVAALFQPLRRRVQRVVDHRYNRSHYDAGWAAAVFGEHLRNQVDLDSLDAEVLQAVAQTVGPATIGLWLRQAEIET